ncbi:MAG TPA: zinc ribbon domain-containing protein [Candidatus Saccharimonadales bacterium]|nr:zinc ribbon domain-containing protein [Candidatus Saccharimonadales bacterium]
MPIYEYQCQKCGTFEATQRITEKALAKCPTCKGKVKKLISNTSFQLKGTGWYVTDYARKGKNGESKGDSKSEDKSESSTKPASDTKTESKKSESSSTSGDKSTSTSTAST